jgi:hypothetical protein
LPEQRVESDFIADGVEGCAQGRKIKSRIRIRKRIRRTSKSKSRIRRGPAPATLGVYRES